MDGSNDLPDLSDLAIKPKKKQGGDESVARVIDDELSKLGWADNARLSFLGDVGRENGWSRDVIFGGHADPKNQSYNRGIISWQGSRRTKLDDYLKTQNVLGKNDDDELRGMVRFADEEMKNSPEWNEIHSAVRNPNISTYDASENLRKYIKYVPDGKYNSPDPDFRVKNNAKWARDAQHLGLGKLPDLSDLAQAGASEQENQLPDLSDLAQPINAVGEGATVKTDLRTGAATPKSPVPESDFTIQAQVDAAVLPDSPRAAILLTEQKQITQIPKEAARLFTSVFTKNGNLLVNNKKAAERFNLKTPKEISRFVEKKGFAALIGKNEDVGDATGAGAVALRTEDDSGRELSTSAVTSPESAQRQAQIDSQSFPDAARQEIIPAEEAVAKRLAETTATLGEIPGTENVFPEAAPIAPQTIADLQPTAQSLPPDYLEYLKVRELPDSPELRNEYSQVLKDEQEAYDNSPIPSPSLAAVNTGARRQNAPQNAETVVMAENQPTIQAPNALAPGTAANIARESLGTIDLTNRYQTKPTVDRVIEDLTRTAYGDNFNRAAESYQKLTGEPLITFNEIRPAVQQQIDANYDPNTGTVAGVRVNREAEVNRVVEAFDKAGEDGIRNLLGQTAEVKTEVAESLRAEESARNEQSLRQRAIDELKAEKEPPSAWTTAGIGTLIGDTIGDAVFGDESKEATEEEISQRIEQIRSTSLDDEATRRATEVGKRNENFGVGGQLLGGFYGSVGRTMQTAAGMARPLASVGIEKPYEWLSKTGSEMQLSGETSAGDSWTGTAANLIGGLPTDLLRLSILSRTPSGSVISFAADSSLQSAGRGENWSEIQKQGTKGAAIGALFPVASVVGKSVASSPLIQSAVRVGIIGAGTTGIELFSGTPLDQSIKAGLTNALFELAPIAKDKLFNKIGRIWQKGKAIDISIDETGSVSLIRYKDGANPNRVDFEMVLDPTDGVYKDAGEVALNRGSKFEPKDNPRELLGENPKRVEVAQPEALQKISVDTRAQKIVENIKDGKTYTVEQLQKTTKYNKNNVEETLLTLYSAKQIEILPDNSVRFIGGSGSTTIGKSLFERAAEIKKPSDIINLPKSSVESKLDSSDSTVAPAVKQPSNENLQRTLAAETKSGEKLESSSNEKVDDLSIYEALPQQKAQETAVEKPKAKLDFAERENIAEKLNVFTERGTKAQIEPRVVEQSDLLTSLDEGYPQEFQPRDRSRAASKAQISEIAGRLNPEFLGDSPKASDGRPLAVPVSMPDGTTKYAVISGNGRTQGIREAYNLDNDGAKSYKEFVQTKGGADLNQPVYVGILDPQEIPDFSEFAKESNESATAQMSASEQAKSDADRLDASVLNLFVPSDDGTIHGAANRDFTRAFLDKTTSTSERNRYVDSEGKLNQEGVTKVKNAIFAKAFGNSEMGTATLQRMAESTDSNIKNITNALLAKAGELSSFAAAAKDNRRFADADIAPDFARAMEKYSELKDAGTSIDEYIRQGALFGADTSPLQTRVMQVFDFYKRRSKSIKGIIDNYIQAAEALGDPNQQGLFGAAEVPSKESIFEAAVRHYERENSGAADEENGQISLLDTGEGRENQPGARRENNDVAQEIEGREIGAGSKESGQNRLDAPLYSKAESENIFERRQREVLARDLSRAIAADLTPAVLKDAKIDPSGKLNEAGAVVLTHAKIKAFGENAATSAWFGTFLNPQNAQAVRGGLENLFAAASNPFTKVIGKRLLVEYDAAVKENGSVTLITSSRNAPNGLKTAWQEESAHEFDYFEGGKHKVSTDIIENDPVGIEAIDNMQREGAYKNESRRTIAREIAAKIWVDGNTETGLSSEKIEYLQKQIYNAYRNNGASAENLLKAVENLSKTGQQYVERERNFGRSSGNSVESVARRSGENESEISAVRGRTPIQPNNERPYREGNRQTDTENRQSQDLNNFAANTGNQSLAARTRDEILYSRPPNSINPEETKSEAEKATKTLMSYIYDGKRDVSPTEAAMNILRTGYLAGVSVLKTNLLGNTSNIVVEQLAKPLMATADILNPKAKTRTTPGLSGFDVVEGFFGKDGFFRAGFTGEKGVLTALIKGVDHQESARVDMNINDKNTNFVRNTGVPAIDAIIEATKRIVTGVDRPFKAYARSAEKSGLARLEASKENRGVFNTAKNRLDGEWVKNMRNLRSDPSALINDVAERYAEVVTFQNPNAVTATYDKFRRFLIDEKAQARIIPTTTQRKIAKYVGSATYLTTGQAAPFMSTPSNVGFRTMEYFFPTGVMAAAFKFHRIGQSLERQSYVEEEALRRSKTVRWLSSVRNRQDAAFNKETSAKKDRLNKQRAAHRELTRAQLEKVRNNPDLSPEKKNARKEEIKTAQEKWAEGWQKNRDKYLAERQALADKATAERKVSDDIRVKEWESEDAYADLKFSAFENRAFAEAAGRAGFGATVGSLALLGVIYGLIKAVGTTDYDDEPEKSKQKRAAGIPDDSVSVGGYRLPYADNPFGNALKMGINLFEQYERQGSGLDRTGAMTKRFGKDVTSLNPLTAQEFTKKDWSSWAGSRANAMTPILNMKILQEIAEVADDKPRKYWEEGFAAQYLIKIPKLRENLPESKSFIGGTKERGDVWRRLVRLIDPLKTTKENKPQTALPKAKLRPKKPS